MPLYVTQLQPNTFYDVECWKRNVLGGCSAHRGMCWEGEVPIGECVGRGCSSHRGMCWECVVPIGECVGSV